MRSLLLATLLTVGLGAARQFTDWPQYVGAARNGVHSGPALADAWPASGPPVVWRNAVGAGFNGPVMAGGPDAHVILFHRIAGREVVESLDAEFSEASTELFVLTGEQAAIMLAVPPAK
jgi:hypothetical protein